MASQVKIRFLFFFEAKSLSFVYSGSIFIITRRALAWEGDYKRHHVCAWVRVCRVGVH